MLHITLAVDLARRVGTVGSKLRELSDLERETLTVDDMPMERVDLDPTHRVKRPQQVRDRETRYPTLLKHAEKTWNVTN